MQGGPNGPDKREVRRFQTHRRGDVTREAKTAAMQPQAEDGDGCQEQEVAKNTSPTP